MRRGLYSTALLGIALVLGLGLIVSCRSQLSGEQLLQERCTGCHTLAPIQSAQKTYAGWEQTVYTMIERGADLNDREAEVLIDYLSETYAPE